MNFPHAKSGKSMIHLSGNNKYPDKYRGLLQLKGKGQARPCRWDLKASDWMKSHCKIGKAAWGKWVTSFKSSGAKAGSGASHPLFQMLFIGKVKRVREFIGFINMLLVAIL